MSSARRAFPVVLVLALAVLAFAIAVHGGEDVTIPTQVLASKIPHFSVQLQGAVGLAAPDLVQTAALTTTTAKARNPTTEDEGPFTIQLTTLRDRGELR